MKVLVIGSGGREHAMAWKIAHSNKVTQVYVAPGNGGTAADHRLTSIALNTPEDICAWAVSQHIDLTLVGPEAPLAQGVVDLFRAQGLKIFGPTQQAAQLESSKAFAKSFMVRHSIPTASHQTFSDATLAHEYVEQQGAPIVIKADGLAAGKGVVVATNLDQAHQAIDDMLSLSGGLVVVEEFLEGEEASFMVMVDGAGNILPLASSQDHKRLLDADKGPNTGGMGAYSPAPVVTPEIHAKVMREIIRPTVQGMKSDGIPFTGFLYAGLMISPNGTVKTLEFNCRMGDPETQPILMRMKSDWVPILDAAVNDQLDKVEIEWDKRCALGVVLAAAGYPASPQLGVPIQIQNVPTNDVMVFHAGTRYDHESKQLVTHGGRVACVTALGINVSQAQKLAYSHIHDLDFTGKQYRCDIGFRALQKN
ncbi:MAG: Phosphoribosylamine--glycine ligase [Pseudomonadota bacterium]|jgi:phosphoribosylamine--glycine ligase